MENINLFGCTTAEKLIKLEKAINGLYSIIGELGVFISNETYIDDTKIYNVSNITQDVSEYDVIGRPVLFINQGYLAYINTYNKENGDFTISGGLYIKGEKGDKGDTGEQGERGLTGNGIQSMQTFNVSVGAENTETTIRINYTQQNPSDVKIIAKNGINGINGINGKDGNGIVAFSSDPPSLDPSGLYTVTPINVTMEEGEDKSFEVYAEIGERGLTGTGVSHFTQGQSYVAGENTVTPITVEYTDGTTQPLTVLAKNGADGGITVDSQMSLTSENPVQNKIVTEAINTGHKQYRHIIEIGLVDGPIDKISIELITGDETAFTLSGYGSVFVPYIQKMLTTTGNTIKGRISALGGQKTASACNFAYYIFYQYGLNLQYITIPIGEVSTISTVFAQFYMGSSNVNSLVDNVTPI